ncbi:MAG TPA: PhnD/SsuA/transferrin family substrate-binding protein [bacterium]|nr:PhnD/SsuA/transferrin family substrate-binding protein [bacterium]HPN29401.1 PhnD/SsuA/transferrin family substrate-binding protein [bacterium]
MKKFSTIVLSIIFFQISFASKSDKISAADILINRRQSEFRVAQSGKSLDNINSSDAKAALEIWFNQFFKENNYDVKINVALYNNIDLIINDLNENKIDYLTLNSIEYCRIKEKVPIEGLMAGYQNRKITKDLVLVTRRGDIKTLKDLQNKKIIVDISNFGDLPIMWLDTMLLKANMPAHMFFFKSVKKVYKSSQAVMPVYFNQDFDACLLNENAYNILTELNPNISEKLRIIERSPSFLGRIFCASKNTDQEMKKKLIGMINDMNNNVKSKQGLALFKVDKLVLFDSKDMATVENLIKEYDELLNKKK